jgi:hypothetical protein
VCSPILFPEHLNAVRLRAFAARHQALSRQITTDIFCRPAIHAYLWPDECASWASQLMAPFLLFHSVGPTGGTMALREFTDADGVRWKAWDVTADQIHPKTRAEDYMHDLADGWLVFERTDGEEKRRLCPYPNNWEECSDAELLGLWKQADKVARRATPSMGSWKVGDPPIPPRFGDDKSAR